jgi:CheY-like chemotaxis protein
MARVLVADDDARQLELRAALLEAAGYEVASAVSVADIERQLARVTPDVLVMDLRYPNSEGAPDAAASLALIRATREQRPGLPVIVISGWPEELDALPEGKCVARVVAKPYRMQTLLDAIREVLPLLACLLAFTLSASAQTFPFRVARRAEVVAELEMSSPGSDWAKGGREAALATLQLDGTPAQHVMLYAGAARHTYGAFLGALDAGAHQLRIERHAKFSAAGSGLAVHGVRFRQVAPGDPEYATLASAPILYARADTIGLFTDVPLIAYCERLIEAGKPLLQYTTIFSNEDGGTSTRALMARWGRTTDIEYIYKRWLSADGSPGRATIQAKDHKEIEFDGRYEGSHPVLIPSTRNNMVSGQGASEIRYQIPPALVDLSSAAREETMDRQPITYQVMAKELVREEKLRAYGVVKGESISDPRNYLFLEARTENATAALGFRVQLHNDPVWYSSHLGRADYGVVRSGYFRTTVELPPGTRAADIVTVAAECMVETARPMPTAGTCRFGGVTKAFFLTPQSTPGPNLFRIAESAAIPSGQMRAYPVRLTHVAGATSGAWPAHNPLSASR